MVTPGVAVTNTVGTGDRGKPTERTTGIVDPAAEYARALRRRREASWRLPPIECADGRWRRDPWHARPIPVTGSPYGMTDRETMAEAARLIGAEWSVEEVVSVLGVVAVELRRVA